MLTDKLNCSRTLVISGRYLLRDAPVQGLKFLHSYQVKEYREQDVLDQRY